MDPEAKELLQNTLLLTEENNKILHQIRGVQKREAIWRVLKILVIVGIAFGSFYFLEPYLDKVMSMYDGVKTNIDSVNSMFDGLNLKK